jgi:hypothetical protein
MFGMARAAENFSRSAKYSAVIECLGSQIAAMPRFARGLNLLVSLVLLASG